MLFMKPGESKLIRIQGTLIKDKEIERVVEFLKAQAQPVYDEEILKEKKASASGNTDKDELFDEAVQIVMECNQASVSILQRRMRLGYTRAARIIDQMEDAGYVGPYEGSKPRKILVDRDEWMSRQLQVESGEKQ
jgi:S-DNA-T family DNA segregation ATPase FtsK/SpoIIIE